MSDSPDIIRQEPEHSVTITEGSQVATSKPSDPIGPQVRKTLASEQDAEAIELPAIPPRIAGEPRPEGVVFERSVGGEHEERVEAPEALAAGPAQDAPVFERSIQDRLESGEAPPEAAAPASEAPVLERSYQDHREALPAQEGQAGEGEAPVFERSLQDHHELLPTEPDQAQGEMEAPVLERSLQDRFVPVPPEALSVPQDLLPVPELAHRVRRPIDLPGRIEPTLREAPPVPRAAAQRQVEETAQQVQARVEESIGAADSEWTQMDFPARVVKLKIENDKVRAKLDDLEKMAPAQRR